MINVIIDTNLWVSFLIGKRTERLRTLFLRDDIRICMCKEMIQEIMDVLCRPKLRKYISHSDIEDFLNLIYTYCSFYEIKQQSTLKVRDPKDLYILSLAETIPANVILSGDKDLLELETNSKFKIYTLSKFLDIVE